MSVKIRRNEDRDGEIGEGSVAFSLTVPVDPALLDTELSAEMNWRKDGGIVVEGDPSWASEDEPVTLWVMRDDVDAKVLQRVVSAHERPEEPEEAPLAAYTRRAAEGDTFDADEVQEILRLLLLRP